MKTLDKVISELPAERRAKVEARAAWLRTTDIKPRLLSDGVITVQQWDELRQEAAAEIDRLRAALTRLLSLVDDAEEREDIVAQAREALRD